MSSFTFDKSLTCLTIFSPVLHASVYTSVPSITSCFNDLTRTETKKLVTFFLSLLCRSHSQECLSSHVRTSQNESRSSPQNLGWRTVVGKRLFARLWILPEPCRHRLRSWYSDRWILDIIHHWLFSQLLPLDWARSSLFAHHRTFLDLSRITVYLCWHFWSDITRRTKSERKAVFRSLHSSCWRTIKFTSTFTHSQY